MICPYHYARYASKHVDILCLPYDYLCNENLTKELGININNSIIVMDEAHNFDNKSK